MRIGNTEPRGDGQMSFREIARALNTSPSNAWMLYRSALRKLRKKGVRMRALRELARCRDVSEV